MTSRAKKFLSYYKPYLGVFLSVMVCAFLVAAITLIFPLCARYITKDLLPANRPDVLNQIYAIGVLMLLLVALHTACNYYVAYQGHTMGARMENDLRQELFEHYQKLSFRFYDEHRTGQLMSRITNDLFLLSELYHHGPEDIVIYTVKFLGAFLILIHINVQLTLAVFLLLPVMFIYAYLVNKKVAAALKTNFERIGDINAQVEDTLSGIRVVKSFANEAIEIKKFAHENRRFLESKKITFKWEGVFFEGLTGFTQLILVGVILFGSISISRAWIDLADLIIFLLYINNFIEPILKFGHIAGQYQQGFTGFARFMEIMELEPDMQDAPDAIELRDAKGDIEFRNVGFRYHDDQPRVLKNICLKVRAGETIALVGPSGVGKTTLCSLIPRFYDATEGEILLDGINIKDIGLHSLRKHVGVVQQDGFLFAGTVLENIRYGKPDANEAEIIAAAKKANAHDFIQALPYGYETNIGQRGVKLSGGQKQRLSIARVFLKNPPVLIFDEATSSLDSDNERMVQRALEELAKDRTTFIIAHRLTTIRGAVKILVLTDRGIEEQGTHKELMASGGIYARLYTMQFDHQPAPHFSGSKTELW